LAQETTRIMLRMASEIDDEDKRKGAAKWALNSQNRNKLEAIIAVAHGIPGIVVEHTVFDSNHWLVNVANGTLDLRTGELKPHNRYDLITKLINVPYDVNATCPLWLKFLNRIFGSNQQLIDYVQKAVGYSLTGDVSEQCLHFCYGEG